MDRVGNLGDTEAHYRDMARHFGLTETGFGGSEMLGFHGDVTFGLTDSHNSMAPRCTCAMARAKSVGPKIPIRSVRDAFGGNLTLNFLLESRSNELIWWKVNCIRGKITGSPIVH